MKKLPFDILTKEGFDLEHFREVLEMIPIIQQKTLEGIAVNKEFFIQNNQRQFKERAYLTEFIEVIQGKWFIDVIYLIIVLEKPHFNDLKNSLSGINSRTLTDRLRQLEEKGVVTRHIVDARPVRVFYILTDYGEGLSGLFILFYLYSLFHKEIDVFRKQLVK